MYVRANSSWFELKMATGYFEGFASVLQFCSHLIVNKKGLHFSNQVKIKILFRNSIFKHFWAKMWIQLKVLLNGHYYPINGNSLTGRDKQVVRHETNNKKTYI